MFENIVDNLDCDFCEKGQIYYSPADTLDAYFVPETFALTEVGDVIDKVINEYLVFKCAVCGAVKKYTFKDIEKKVRENMYEQVINTFALKEFRDIKNLNLVDKTLIYCGK